MKIVQKILKAFIDFLEIQVPSVLFIIMYFSFVMGVIFRYFLRNPQPWTFELSTISFVMMAFLAACTAQRNEDNVAFDLIYSYLKPKGQNIMRIISNAIVIVFLSIAIPSTLKYLWDMRELTTAVLKIPRFLVFTPFTIMFIITVLRFSYHLIEDIKALKDKTYVQRYNTEEKGVLL